MTDRELMQQALDALEKLNKDGWILADFEDEVYASIEALRARLAQPEQKPVAWQLWVGADTPFNAPMGWHFYNTYDSLRSAETSARTINSAKQAPFAKLVSLYTAPPQREWVGLTNDEIESTIDEIAIDAEDKVLYPMGSFAHAIEAKLKQKNAL